jgi:broad specificity phosphatase PhoE
MEIILVRHAEPAWADERGHAINDPGLTERGRRQAEIVAARLARELDGPTELLVSTAQRARETGGPIASALALEPRYQEWIHEIRLPPEWEGTPAEEVSRVLREHRHRPREAWFDGIPGHGESFLDFHERVTAGLEATLNERGVERHRSDEEHLWWVPDDLPRLVIIGHAGTNSSILGHLLGLTPEPWEWERFSSNHASVTRLDTTAIAGGRIWSLQLFSGVGHFEPDLVTS